MNRLIYRTDLFDQVLDACRGWFHFSECPFSEWSNLYRLPGSCLRKKQGRRRCVQGRHQASRNARDKGRRGADGEAKKGAEGERGGVAHGESPSGVVCAHVKLSSPSYIVCATHRHATHTDPRQRTHPQTARIRFRRAVASAFFGSSSPPKKNRARCASRGTALPPPKSSGPS